MIIKAGRETGKIVMGTSEEFEAAEIGERDDDLEWQHDNIELAEQIITNAESQFVELPSKFEINEYEIMESFCYSIHDREISNE